VKTLAFMAAAATLILTLPASAQGIKPYVGAPGVRIGVERPHYHDRYRYEGRRHYRRGDTVIIDRRRGWDRPYHHRRPGRTVIIER